MLLLGLLLALLTLALPMATLIAVGFEVEEMSYDKALTKATPKVVVPAMKETPINESYKPYQWMEKL